MAAPTITNASIPDSVSGTNFGTAVTSTQVDRCDVADAGDFGSPPIVNGVFYKALSLNGTTQGRALGNTWWTDFRSFTIRAWVYFNNTASANESILRELSTINNQKLIILYKCNINCKT